MAMEATREANDLLLFRRRGSRAVIAPAPTGRDCLPGWLGGRGGAVVPEFDRFPGGARCSERGRVGARCVCEPSAF